MILKQIFGGVTSSYSTGVFGSKLRSCVKPINSQEFVDRASDSITQLRLLFKSELENELEGNGSTSINIDITGALFTLRIYYEYTHAQG